MPEQENMEAILLSSKGAPASFLYLQGFRGETLPQTVMVHAHVR